MTAPSPSPQRSMLPALFEHPLIGGVQGLLAVVTVAFGDGWFGRIVGIALLLCVGALYLAPALGLRLSAGRLPLRLVFASLVLLVVAAGLVGWRLWTAYTEVPLTAYPLRVHAWDHGSYTFDSDGREGFHRLDYKLPGPGTYAGLGFTLSQAADLGGFRALRVRISFDGDADRCLLYFKNEPETKTDDGLLLGRNLLYPTDVRASAAGGVQTLVIPFEPYFNDTSTRPVREIGVQVGSEPSVRAGACRIHELTLLRFF